MSKNRNTNAKTCSCCQKLMPRKGKKRIVCSDRCRRVLRATK